MILDKFLSSNHTSLSSNWPSSRSKNLMLVKVTFIVIVFEVSPTFWSIIFSEHAKLLYDVHEYRGKLLSLCAWCKMVTEHGCLSPDILSTSGQLVGRLLCGTFCIKVKMYEKEYMYTSANAHFTALYLNLTGILFHSIQFVIRWTTDFKIQCRQVSNTEHLCALHVSCFTIHLIFSNCNINFFVVLLNFCFNFVCLSLETNLHVHKSYFPRSFQHFTVSLNLGPTCIWYQLGPSWSGSVMVQDGSGLTCFPWFIPCIIFLHCSFPILLSILEVGSLEG